jgi:hypothetical protein
MREAEEGLGVVVEDLVEVGGREASCAFMPRVTIAGAPSSRSTRVRAPPASACRTSKPPARRCSTVFTATTAPR